MANPKEIKIPLRIMVDKKENKVIFAESENDFVDILFSFLTLPMGTIVRLLAKHSNSQPDYAIGSLTTLYQGITNLDTKYFSTEECRKMLLNPKNSAEDECRKLKLNVDDTEPTKFFICADNNCIQGTNPYLSTYDTARCSCGKLMKREIGLKDSNVNTSHSNGGVFATETASFIITDDLHVMPNLPGSSLGLLNDVGITDMRVLQQKTLNIGTKEILNLLKWSLFSRTPLTNLYLGREIVKSEPGTLAQPQMGKETTTNSRKMTVKLMMRKSDKQQLFVQADEDFIDFLFSFLTIPLGKVVCLLGGNTTLGSIDNLFKSISKLDIGKYMKSKAVQDMLLNPGLALQHLSKNQIFSLHEAQGYYNLNIDYPGDQPPTIERKPYYYSGLRLLKFKNPKVEVGFVKGPAMFMVTHNLAVTPLSSMSTLSFLSELKIPPSDVEEQIVSIGMEEALSMLKASLNSTAALTNGLNLALNKRKQEKYVSRLIKGVLYSFIVRLKKKSSFSK